MSSNEDTELAYSPPSERDSTPRVSVLPSSLKRLELSISVARSLDELLALRSDYERLQRATANTLPFALHDWHMAWCNHFLSTGKRIQSQMLIHALRNGAGECVAIVPLIRTRRAVGPIGVHSIDLLGADPAITEIRGPLVESGYEASVAFAIQHRLMAQVPYDWIQWHGIMGEFAETLRKGAALLWREPLVDYVLDLPATWDMFRANLKRNIRESIRHCYNSLKRDGHVFELQVAERPHEVEQAVERFFVLHSQRATVIGTTNHPDHFKPEVSRRFLREVTARLALQHRVRVFELRIGADVVATRIGFVVGDSLYLYYSGYDLKWSRYSVMTTTLVEAIKYAISEGLASVNLTPGNDVSKTRWSPREIDFPRATQVHSSRLSKWAFSFYLRATSKPTDTKPLGMISRRTRRHWS